MKLFYYNYFQQLTHATGNKNEYNNNNNNNNNNKPGIESASLGTVSFDAHKFFIFPFLCVL